MAHRRIVDDRERVWDVWEVIPSLVEPTSAPLRGRAPDSGRRLVVPPELQSGWLAFQCGEERRRIAPLPPSWSDMTDALLLRLLSAATPVETRKRSH
jgi:hypothetical protein